VQAEQPHALVRGGSGYDALHLTQVLELQVAQAPQITAADREQAVAEVARCTARDALERHLRPGARQDAERRGVPSGSDGARRQHGPLSVFLRDLARAQQDRERTLDAGRVGTEHVLQPGHVAAVRRAIVELERPQHGVRPGLLVRGLAQALAALPLDARRR
jgi:hypothetical protein